MPFKRNVLCAEDSFDKIILELLYCLLNKRPSDRCRDAECGAPHLNFGALEHTIFLFNAQKTEKKIQRLKVQVNHAPTCANMKLFSQLGREGNNAEHGSISDNSALSS